MIATPPFIPGHEATGTVVLAGPDSTVQVTKWNQNCLCILISNFALYLYLDKVSMKPDFGKAKFFKIEWFWKIAKSVSILFNQTASIVGFEQNCDFVQKALILWQTFSFKVP